MNSMPATYATEKELSVSAAEEILEKMPSTATICDFSKVGTAEGRQEPMWVPDNCVYSKDHFVLPKHYEESLKYIMLPKGLLNDRIEKLGMEIRKEYGDAELHVLCILKGSRGFFSELLEILDRIHRYTVGDGYQKAPYMEHYIRLKSYHNMESTDNLQVMSDDLNVLKGKDVLIVEDIIDTGSTLKKFCKHLEDFEPKSIKVASLLEKRTPKSCDFKGDYVGFSVPDEFIVGYCLDYNEHFRDLDHVCVMNEAGIAKYAK